MANILTKFKMQRKKKEIIPTINIKYSDEESSPLSTTSFLQMKKIPSSRKNEQGCTHKTHKKKSSEKKLPSKHDHEDKHISFDKGMPCVNILTAGILSA